MNILLSFEPKDGDWRCYNECLPDKVMKKFEEVYL